MISVGDIDELSSSSIVFKECVVVPYAAIIGRDPQVEVTYSENNQNKNTLPDGFISFRKMNII